VKSQAGTIVSQVGEPLLDIRGCVRDELRPDERVLWTGRPPQALVILSRLVWIPIGLALVAVGWMMMMRHERSVHFERIDDPQTVERMVMQHVTSLEEA
jgi:hypothetical protein